MEKKELKAKDKKEIRKPNIGECATFVIGKETVDCKTFMNYIYSQNAKKSKPKIKKAS